MVRVCKQKAKNIKGIVAEEFVVFRGINKPPKDIEDLLEDHEKYGYSPLTTTAFKTIKKRMCNKQEGPIYLDNDIWYICVPVRKKKLSLVDFTCNNYDPYDNLHNMNPEEVLEKSEGLDWDGKWMKFNSSSNQERTNMIHDFINKNKGNPTLKEELKTAKRFLEAIEEIKTDKEQYKKFLRYGDVSSNI